MDRVQRLDPTDLAALGGRAGTNAGTGMLVAGAALTVLGVWSIGTTLELVPSAIADAVRDWWAAGALAVGVVLVARGQRALGGLICAVAGVVLVATHVPSELVWPTLLIAAGLVVVASATRGRRWLLDGSGFALFGDRDVTLDARSRTRSLVALFGDTRSHLGADLPQDVPIDCLAVFGSVELTVPSDVAVRLRETSVFGDVRAPQPTRGAPSATIDVRATSVFGDVRIRRA